MSQLLRKSLSVYMDENKGDEGGGGGGGDTPSDEVEGVNDDNANANKGENHNGDDNKGKISDNEAKLLKEVMDKKNALKKAQGELSVKNDLIKKIEELGGLDALTVIATEKKTADQKKLEEKGEWDRLKAQMNEGHEQVLAEKNQLLADAIKESQRLSGVIADLTVGGSFESSQFIKESLVIPARHARKIYGGHFEFENGVAVAYDKPAGSAERTMYVDAKGDPLNFDAAMQKIIDADPERDHLLKSKTKPGAGSVTFNKTKAPESMADELSGQQRIALALNKAGLTK